MIADAWSGAPAPGRPTINDGAMINGYRRLNGYKDATAMRLAPYESANFTQEVTDAWEQLKPLYQQIHAYVRHKLAKR